MILETNNEGVVTLTLTNTERMVLRADPDGPFISLQRQENGELHAFVDIEEYDVSMIERDGTFIISVFTP